jgi:hypothetical protein
MTVTSETVHYQDGGHADREAVLERDGDAATLVVGARRVPLDLSTRDPGGALLQGVTTEIGVVSYALLGLFKQWGRAYGDRVGFEVGGREIIAKFQEHPPDRGKDYPHPGVTLYEPTGAQTALPGLADLAPAPAASATAPTSTAGGVSAVDWAVGLGVVGVGLLVFGAVVSGAGLRRAGEDDAARLDALRERRSKFPFDVDQVIDEELLSGSYYHATSQPLPIGAVIESRGSDGWTPRAVDEVRPTTPRRNDHLFMVRDPACLDTLGREPDDRYVYRVTPVMPVQRADFGWLERIADVARGRLTIGQRAVVERELREAGWTTEPYRQWGGGVVDVWVRPDGTVAGQLEAVLKERYARNYWAGVPTEPCMDEYLTMAFKVEERA